MPAPYRVDLATAAKHLAEELRLWRADAAALSTDMRLNQRGGWYSNDKAPADPGVALAFCREGQQMVVACDVWNTVRGNLRAIGLMVEGLRAIERTQVGEMMRRAYRGLAALPAPGDAAPVRVRGREWWRDVLGVDERADGYTVRAAYHRCAREAHPDAGGSNERMAAVNAAWAAADAFFGATPWRGSL